VVTMDQAQQVTATFNLEGGPGPGPLTITDVNVASGKSFLVMPDGLQSGATVYIDRNYTY